MAGSNIWVRLDLRDCANGASILSSDTLTLRSHISIMSGADAPDGPVAFGVYSGGEVCLATYSLPEVIGKANETMGVVIGDGQKYIWKRARKTNCPS